MEAKYNFKVGDEVVTIEGVTGVITNICHCSSCFERGYYEPVWTSHEDGSEHYITVFDRNVGFLDYHRIGDYIFCNLEKSCVLSEIAYHENEVKKLRKRLGLIERLEEEENGSEVQRM